MNWKLCRVAAVLAVLTFTWIAAGQEYSVDWWTIDGGGGTSEGSGFTLSGTSGQSDAGTMTGNGFALSGGFWYPTPPGDCNVTGTIDLLDFDLFERCLSGPMDPTDGTCLCSDLDGDDDVDLRDFGTLQTALHGP